MKRRSFILGTGSVAAGGSALLGTGAFSMVESHRSVTVQVAEDDNAYLGMDACRDGDGNPTPNSSFMEISSATNGHLEIDMGDSGNGGMGVNSQSTSWFDNVFQLCNQGKEDVCLWIANKEGEDPDRVTLYVNEDDGESTPDKFVDEEGDLVAEDPDLQTFTGVDDSILLEVGECVCVGIQVFTREDENFEITQPAEDDVLLEQIDLVADVGEDACRAEPECADIDAAIDCYTEAEADDEDFPSSTTFVGENVGDGTPETDSIGFAILDSPDEENSVIANDETLAPGESSQFTADTGLPLRGIVFWEQDADCPAPTRDEWEADDGNLTSIDEDIVPADTVGSLDDLTQDRLDEVRDIGTDSDRTDFEEFADAFDDEVADLEEKVSEDAYVREIDLSELTVESVDDWEAGDVSLPECDSATDADLTFDDQSLSEGIDGSVLVEDVTTNGSAQLFVLDSDETIAGLSLLAEVEDSDELVELEAGADPPNGFEAIVVGSGDVSGDYVPGDQISNDTDNASLDRDQAQIGP